MANKKRQSNFELLRILAMMMIVTLHFFSEERRPTGQTPSELVYFTYESLSICGVDIFVLLTGFFSLHQHSINIRKIVNLLIDVAFWCFIGFVLCVATRQRPFQIKELIRSMFPIIFGGRWFVKAYILLLLLSPFINLVLLSISRESFRCLLVIQLLLFSIWPSFFPNPPFDDYGYSIVHFITLYMIAGYIRLHVEIYPSRLLCCFGYLISFAAVIISKLLNQGYEWAYNYPFVMTEAICLFLLFCQIPVQSNLLNRIASAAFGVYLIHTNAFFGPLIYERLFHGSSLLDGDPLMLALAVPICAVCFYLFGFVLETIKQTVFCYSIDSVLDGIRIINTPIRVEGAEKT